MRRQKTVIGHAGGSSLYYLSFLQNLFRLSVFLSKILGNLLRDDFISFLTPLELFFVLYQTNLSNHPHPHKT